MTDLSHFSHLKSGSVPLTSTMHIIVALSPIGTVVFFGRLFCKMGRDRGLSGEKMMEIDFFKRNILVIGRPKVPVLYGVETRQIESCFNLQLKSSHFFIVNCIHLAREYINNNHHLARKYARIC